MTGEQLVQQWRDRHATTKDFTLDVYKTCADELEAWLREQQQDTRPQLIDALLQEAAWLALQQEYTYIRSPDPTAGLPHIIGLLRNAAAALSSQLVHPEETR